MKTSAAAEQQRYGTTVWQRWFEKLVTTHILFPRLNQGFVIARARLKAITVMTLRAKYEAIAVILK